MSKNNRRYRCWTKATRNEQGNPRRSMNWVVARRSWFEVYDDRIECANWVIPFDEVSEAIAYRVSQMFIPGTVLELRTEDKVFQFGFNPWANPLKHLNLDFHEEHVQLRVSPASLLIRLALVGLIVYVVLKDWLRL